jgi:hypothetical protein
MGMIWGRLVRLPAARPRQSSTVTGYVATNSVAGSPLTTPARTLKQDPCGALGDVLVELPIAELDLLMTAGVADRGRLAAVQRGQADRDSIGLNQHDRVAHE